MLLEKQEARNRANGPSPSGDDIRQLASNLTAKPKQVRRAGTVHYEEGGRYLYSHGANGVTVFDIWKWTGEPLERRRP